MTQKDEALRMNIDESKEFLRHICNKHFNDKTFNHYIEARLAGDFACEIANYIKSALSEPETVTLPDGWVAVPVEPTEKMMNIYKDYHDRGEAYKDITIYKSMLQAAPTLNEKG